MGKALVTGGSRGIGLAIALKLASAGHSVVLAGRDGDKLAQEVKTLDTSSGQSHSIAVFDLADHNFEYDIPEDVDILVNNAGYATLGPLQSVNPEELTRMFQVNVSAGLLLAKSFETSRNGRPGNIIFIASVAGVRPFGMGATYAATKAANINTAGNLAIELAPKGIRVNSISPGTTESDATAEVSEDIMKPFTEKSLINKGKMIPASAIGDAALFLLQNPHVTGTNIIVDDGIIHA